ncbi:MAG: hypothetical protein EOO75_17290, partial [Myxococcales bacterium]
MPSWSNVVRLDVREALMRPDLTPLASRPTFWFVQVPDAVSGAAVPARGRWTLDRDAGLGPDTASDPVLRALLAMYLRDRASSRLAAPHDPNFTAALEATWQRLTPDEAHARPFAGTRCLQLTDDGHLVRGADTFALTTVELP